MKLTKGDILRWIWRPGADSITSIYIVLDDEWKEPGLTGFFQVYVLAQLQPVCRRARRPGSIIELDYNAFNQKVKDGMVEKLFDAEQSSDIKLLEV